MSDKVFKFNNKQSIPGLSSMESVSLIRAFNLEKFEPLKIYEMRGGVMNRTYLLQRDDYAFILRKLNKNIDNYNKTEQREFVKFLHRGGLCVPEFLMTVKDDDTFRYKDYRYEVYKYQEGIKYNFENSGHFKAFNDGLIKMHILGRRFKSRFDVKIDLAKKIEKSLNVLYHKYHEWSKIFSYRNDEPLIYISNFLHSKYLFNLGRIKLEQQWIHGDYNPANVVFNKNDQIELIFDFDLSCPNFRGVDLLIAAINTCFLKIDGLDVNDDLSYLNNCAIDYDKIDKIRSKYNHEVGNFTASEVYSLFVFGEYYILRRNLWRLIQSVGNKNVVNIKDIDKYWFNIKEMLNSYNLHYNVD